MQFTQKQPGSPGAGSKPSGFETFGAEQVFDRPFTYEWVNHTDRENTVGDDQVIRDIDSVLGSMAGFGAESAEDDQLARFRDIVPEGFAVNVETSPYIRDVLRRATEHAEGISDRKARYLADLARDGRFAEAPLAVDYMSTARAVVEARRKFGENSPEYQEKRQGLWYNQARRVREAVRRGAWEIFEELPQTLDASGELIADGFSVDKLHEDGINPVTATEEVRRAINDYARLQANKELLQNPENAGMATFGIWMCPEYVQKAYQANPENWAAFGDYVPHIKKMMIVRDRLDTETGTIYHEQIGVSGELFNEDVIVASLQLMGVLEEGEQPENIDIHSIMGMLPDDVTALDIVKVMDKVASRVHGVDSFMGEVMEPGQARDYARAVEEAGIRRQEQLALVNRLTGFVESLAGRDIETRVATGMIDRWVKRELFKLAQGDLSAAEIIFDAKTARAIADADGDPAKLAAAEREAPPAGGCGAGGCGLETVTGVEEQMAREALGIEGDESFIVVKDNERPCRKCGLMTVVYGYNENEVKKACMNKRCGATENVKLDKPDEERPDVIKGQQTLQREGRLRRSEAFLVQIDALFEEISGKEENDEVSV